MSQFSTSPSLFALPERLSAIRSAMARAGGLSALAAREPILLAASKGQDAPVLEEAIKLGLVDFGENRVQEGEQKWASLKKAHKVRLHLIGPLQSNKVKEALALFDVIQTLDRQKLADEIAKHWNSSVPCQQFYIQVNTGKEPQKAGVSPEEADAFILYCLNELKLPVVGLMCIPPNDQPPAPHFALLRTIAQRHGLMHLSMGMSDDFETAIRMGSSCVRVGRALFGERA